jgi:hypothetical protein
MTPRVLTMLVVIVAAVLSAIALVHEPAPTVGVGHGAFALRFQPAPSSDAARVAGVGSVERLNRVDLPSQ